MDHGEVGGDILEAESALGGVVQRLALVSVIVEKIGVFLGGRIKRTKSHRDVSGWAFYLSICGREAPHAHHIFCWTKKKAHSTMEIVQDGAFHTGSPEL